MYPVDTERQRGELTLPHALVEVTQTETAPERNPADALTLAVSPLPTTLSLDVSVTDQV